MNTCAYPKLFENRTLESATRLTRYPFTPNPLVFEPGAPVEGHLNLGVVLFGSATEHFSTVTVALKKAARQGLTGARAELKPQRVEEEVSGTESLWTTKLEKTPRKIESGVPPEAVRVHLLTPLRIKSDGRFVGAKEFRFRPFAASLLRRISLLTHFFGDGELEADFRESLQQSEGVKVRNPSLRWCEWVRYSSRQKAKMNMGGLVGHFEISLEDIGFLWPCLVLGQWTHVGKGCVFGLGKYVLQPAGGGELEDWPSPASLSTE